MDQVGVLVRVPPSFLTFPRPQWLPKDSASLPPSPWPGAQQIGDLVPEPGAREAGPSLRGAGKPETRPPAAAACAPAPRRQGSPGLPRWLRVQGGRKRLSSRRLIGLSCASCFLFQQAPATMVGFLGRSCYLPQSTSIHVFLRLLTPSGRSLRGPLAPASVPAPQLRPLPLPSLPGAAPAPRTPAAGARRRAPPRSGSGSR